MWVGVPLPPLNINKSPKQVLEVKKKRIPDFVYEVFNELLIKHFCSGTAIIPQEEAILGIMRESPGTEITRIEIFDNGWLNIESEYREGKLHMILSTNNLYLKPLNKIVAAFV